MIPPQFHPLSSREWPQPNTSFVRVLQPATLFELPKHRRDRGVTNAADVLQPFDGDGRFVSDAKVCEGCDYDLSGGQLLGERHTLLTSDHRFQPLLELRSQLAGIQRPGEARSSGSRSPLDQEVDAVADLGANDRAEALKLFAQLLDGQPSLMEHADGATCVMLTAQEVRE